MDEVPLMEGNPTRNLKIGSKVAEGLRRKLIDFLRSNSDCFLRPMRICLESTRRSSCISCKSILYIRLSGWKGLNSPRKGCDHQRRCQEHARCWVHQRGAISGMAGQRSGGQEEKWCNFLKIYKKIYLSGIHIFLVAAVCQGFSSLSLFSLPLSYLYPFLW